MPPIIDINRFGGLAPKISPDKLPPHMAQTATNCDVRGGNLKVLSETFTTHHTSMMSGGSIIQGILSADVPCIYKPTTPSLSSVAAICSPLTWLTTITMKAWARPVGSWSWDTLVNSAVTPSSVELTDTGFIVRATVPAINSWSPTAGVAQEVIGPRFQFNLAADSGGANGGPNALANIPSAIDKYDPYTPEGSIPLYYGSIQYGSFNVYNISGPLWDRTIAADDIPGTSVTIEGGVATFIIDLGYAHPWGRHRYYRFCQTFVTSAGLEGPPSDMSDIISVPAGKAVTISTPTTNIPTSPANGTQRIYRAGGDGGSFRLIKESAAGGASTWAEGQDFEQDVVLDELLGNAGGVATSTITSGFLNNSIMHQNGFGIALHSDRLWFSVPYYLHQWPEEWTIKFNDADYIAQSGHTTLVFCSTSGSSANINHVFAVYVDNPAHAVVRDLGAAHPLLAVTGLFRMGDAVGWPSYDGLMLFDGGTVRNLTKDLYSDENWRDLTPASMTCTATTNTIYATGGASNIRVDLSGEEISVTTYSALNGGTASWKSKKFVLDRPQIFDYARVHSTGAITVTITCDGEAKDAVSCSNGIFKVLGTGYGPGRVWEITVAPGANTCYEVELFARNVIPADKTVVLNSSNVDVWGDVRLRFREKDRFVAGTLTAGVHDASANTYLVTLTDGTLYPTSGTISGGKGFFTLPRSSSGTGNNPYADQWKVSVTKANSNPITQPIEELVLFARRTVQTGNVITVSGGGLPEWLYTGYAFPGRRYVRSVQVYHNHTSAIGKIRLYANRAESSPVEFTNTTGLVSGTEYLLSTPVVCEELEFDFVDSSDVSLNHTVIDVRIVAQEIMPVGQTITDPPSWRGLMMGFDDRGAIACGMVKATGTVSVTPTVDGSAQTAISAASGNVFMVPRSIAEGALWEMDVNPSTYKVHSAKFWPRTVVDIGKAPSLRLTPGDPLCPRWCHEAYKTDDKREIVSIRVKAEGTATLNIYLDRATNATATVTVGTSTVETITLASGTLAAFNMLELEFLSSTTPANHLIQEVEFYFKEIIEVNGPVSFTPTHRLGNYFKAASGKMSFAAAAVTASSYSSLTLALTADGSLTPVDLDPNNGGATSLTISNGIPVALARHADGTEFKVDLTTTAEVYNLTLIPRRRVRVEGNGIHEVAPDPAMKPWLGAVYDFPDTIQPVSMIIKASSYSGLYLRVFKDGTVVSFTEAAGDKAISDGNEFALETYQGALLGYSDSLEFDFVNSSGASLNHLVTEFYLFGREVIKIPSSGWVSEPGRKHWLRLLLEFPDTGGFSVGRISASDYTATVTLKPGSNDATSTSFSNSDEVKFSTGVSDKLARQWRLDVAGPDEIYELRLIGRVQRLITGPVLEITHEESPYFWKGLEFRGTRLIAPVAVRVVASDSVTLNFYNSNSSTPATAVATVAVTDAKPVNLPLLHKWTDGWSMDAEHGEGVLVNHLAISFTTIQALGG